MDGLKFTLQVLSDYGYDVPQVGKNICCLFHEETRASARVFEEGSYHCWSAKCGAHFTDGLGAIMHIEECSYPEAIKIAQERYGFKVTDKVIVDLEEIHSLQEVITRKTIESKSPLFLSIYKTLDELVGSRDSEKLRKLYTKLTAGELK